MRLRFSVPLFFFCCVFVHGVFAGPFPPPGMSLLNTGEKNTYGGTAGLLFMVRLSDLPVLWRWKTPGRLSIWGKPRFGIYRMVSPDLKKIQPPAQEL